MTRAADTAGLCSYRVVEAVNKGTMRNPNAFSVPARLRIGCQQFSQPGLPLLGWHHTERRCRSSARGLTAGHETKVASGGLRAIRHHSCPLDLSACIAAIDAWGRWSRQHVARPKSSTAPCMHSTPAEPVAGVCLTSHSPTHRKAQTAASSPSLLEASKMSGSDVPRELACRCDHPAGQPSIAGMQ